MKELGAAGVGGERGSGLSGQLWDLLGIGGVLVAGFGPSGCTPDRNCAAGCYKARVSSGLEAQD